MHVLERVVENMKLMAKVSGISHECQLCNMYNIYFGAKQSVRWKRITFASSILLQLSL
jgi:hypothetical protein